MADAINCSSCGASNQLPEGKNSMFCAFCGGSIVKIETNSNQKTDFESTIKVKPEISQRKTQNEHVLKYDSDTPGHLKTVTEETVVQKGGELSLVNRKIKKIEEITVWFSDNELNEITKLNLERNNLSELNQLDRFQSLKKLNLSNNDFESLNKNLNLSKIKFKTVNFSGNKIKSVLGLSNFSIKEKIDLSYNQIITLDDFPINCDWGFNINLSNNSELLDFSDLAINNILKSKTGYNNDRRIGISLHGCNKFNFETLLKLLKEPNFYVWIYLEAHNNNSDKLKKIGFGKMEEYSDNSQWTWRFPKLDEASNKKNESKGSCFIATATMGSYDHPEVMELRNFRDNWILKKKWGEGFVTWYYHYGSIVAKFIEKSFVLKKLSYLLIVKPLYILSKLIIIKK